MLVVDRRDHVGGNVHDHAHPSGIRIHTYGPHYFPDELGRALARFVNRFSAFYKYEAELKSEVDGAKENWPIARELHPSHGRERLEAGVPRVRRRTSRKPAWR